MYEYNFNQLRMSTNDGHVEVCIIRKYVWCTNINDA